MEHDHEHPLDSIQKLGIQARLTVKTLTQYYLEQLAPEHFHAAPNELAVALRGIRRALSCRVLITELSESDHAQVLEVLGDHPPTPIPDEDPRSRIDHIDAVLQDLAIGLICWHARTTVSFALFEEDQDRLPDCERFQHGDPVIVRAADWTSYPYNSHTGTFLRYSDPRISHEARWAVVRLDGQADEEAVSIRPAHLEFAPEDEAFSSRPEGEDVTGEEAWSEGKPIEIYERLGTWSRDGFTLHLYDTGEVDRLGKSILAYELFDEGFEHYGEEPVFQGADFHCSPLQDRASDGAAADLLGFLSPGPADSDSDRLADYTPEQRRWCEARATDLSFVAAQFEQRHEWRELHLLGQTEEAILGVARYGRVEDIFEVLNLDIFESYEMVEELYRRRDDPPYSELGCLLRELHYLRNVEMVGGEDELEHLYY